jgi:hypothetical protein
MPLKTGTRHLTDYQLVHVCDVDDQLVVNICIRTFYEKKQNSEPEVPVCGSALCR